MTSYETRVHGGTMRRGLAVKECRRCSSVGRLQSELIHPSAHQPLQAYMRPSQIGVGRFSEW
jgi:hypothetical protein